MINLEKLYRMADVKVTGADSLESFQAQKKKKQALLKETIIQRANEHGMVLVRVDDMPSQLDGTRGTALTARQQRWLNTAPNDSITQNPVLYKYTKDVSKVPKRVLETKKERSAVQCLSDTVVAPPPSGIGEIINQRRKERHLQLVADLEAELSVICMEMETLIIKASEELHSQLESNDKVIEGMFSRVSTDEVLKGQTIMDLEQLWKEITGQSAVREQHIQHLEVSLNEVERERTQRIECVMLEYAEYFKQVAFLLSEDVERLMESKSLMANFAVVSNKRSYVQLCTHLRTADCEREMQHHKRWMSLVAKWKQLMYQNAHTTFVNFMENRDINSPMEMNHLKEGLVVEQKRAGLKRKELMDHILNLKPPIISPALIYEWREIADKLYEDLDATHSNFLLKMQHCLDSTQRACEDEMEVLRKHLTSSGAYDSYDAYELMCKDFLPLIDVHSKRMRDDLQALEKALDHVISTQKDQFSDLFHFVQEATLLWNDQKGVIEQILRTYEDNLERFRLQHDNTNQNLEANLDVVLDRLRQCSSTEILKQHKVEALKMLEGIKSGYSTFLDTTIKESKKLPNLVEPDLDFYDINICQHLGVVRQEPRSYSHVVRKRVSRAKSKASSPTKHSKTKLLPNISSTTPKIVITIRDSSQKRSASAGGGTLSATEGETVTYLFVTEEEEKRVESKLSGRASGGGRASVDETSLGGRTSIAGKTSRKKFSKTFMTQEEDLENTHMALATENLLLAGGTFTQVKHCIRVNFLEHLEHWKRKCTKDAVQTVVDKEEAARTELDLRLHLHKPRPLRVTKDIHDVRAAELVAHSDRMNRHVQGVVESIHEHRDTIHTLAEQLSKMSETFVLRMSDLDFNSVLNKRQLAKLKNEGDGIIADHEAKSEEAIAAYKKESEAKLQEITTSNRNYKSSLKLFQDGGNYCPEEIDNLEKKMERIYAKLTSIKVTMAKDLTSLTRSHQQMAADTATTYMKNYNTLFADITFSDALYNTTVSMQVAIKSEVADNNTRAATIGCKIDKFKAHILQAKDKKSLPPSLQDDLSELFALVNRRGDHLFCCDSIKDETPTSTDDDFKPISVVNVSKNILEQTATKKKSQGGGETPAPTESKTEADHVLSKSSVKSNSKAAQSTSDSKVPKSSKKRQSIAMERREFANNLGTTGGHRITSFLPKVRSILKAKYYVMFDMICDYYNKQRTPAKDTELNSMVHLQALHENPEDCLAQVEGKVNAIRFSMEECRQNSIEEFQGQLKRLEPLLVDFIGLAFGDFGRKQQSAFEELVQEEKKKLLNELAKSRAERTQYENSLQPTLGAPGREEEVERLCAAEEERHKAATKCIAEHAQSMRERARKGVLQILMELTKAAKSQLHLMDTFIYPREITDFKPKAKTEMEDLLRQQVSDNLSGTTSRQRASSRWKKIKPKVITSKTVQWPGLPTNKMPVAMSPVQKRTRTGIGELKDKPVSRKVTGTHEEVIRKRDLVFEVQSHVLHAQ